MALSKHQLDNFVGIAIATLRGEISENAQRAKRLKEAVSHIGAVRRSGEDALETSRAQRENREQRLLRATEARQRSLE
jgi:hypothetical protein